MLRIEVFEDVFISRHEIDDNSKTFSGRLFDSNGKAIDVALRSNDRHDTWQLKDVDTVSKYRAVGTFKTRALSASMHLKEAIWGGYLFDAWGHALVESLSTAWAIDELPPSSPVIFYAWGALSNATIVHRTELLKLAGWRNPIIVTTGPCSIGKLHVPERGIEISPVKYDQQRIDQTMNRVFERAVASSVRDRGPAHPIYLSRPAGHRRAMANEREIMDHLSANGIKLLDGWAVPLSEQIATVANASMVIAPSGSSLHNSVFAPRGCKIIEIQDQRATELERSWDLQDALVDLREQHFVKIPAFVNGHEVSTNSVIARLEAELFANAN